jgi:formate/nitrite transporter FocA (FNT family)
MEVCVLGGEKPMFEVGCCFLVGGYEFVVFLVLIVVLGGYMWFGVMCLLGVGDYLGEIMEGGKLGNGFGLRYIVNERYY